jgi:hypothetical protein
MLAQNGWPVYLSSHGLPPLAWITGRVAPGSVWVVLDHLCARFDDEVEPIIMSHSWGYAYRPIRGRTTGYSNHAAGTAIDLNAPAHPLGERGTFTRGQVERIEDILADLDGVVRWGGHYRGRKDEMHFEIVGSRAAVDAVANRIKQQKQEKPVPKTFADHMAAALAALRAARNLTKSSTKRFLLNVAIAAAKRVPDHKETNR